MLDVSSDLLIRDQVVGGQPLDALPIIEARIQRKFAELVQSHAAYQDRFEGTRCAISRRLRMLRDQGKLLANAKEMTESGIDSDRIASYFSSECLGEPSVTNWAEPQR